MRLVPFRYPLRSLFVRRGPTLFAAFGIGLTVAVLAGVLALREGFTSMLVGKGHEDLAVYLRPGALSEGESLVRYPEDVNIIKARPEVEADEKGLPIAAAESYLGIKLEKLDGTGTTLVPVRGVEAMSFRLQARDLRIVEGRMPELFSDEVIVGAPLSRRMKGCRVGETLVFNTTPFKVVGIFVHGGGYESEVWAGVERITAATKRTFRQRVVVKLKPGTDVVALAEALKKDPRLPVEVRTERAYFEAQTSANSTLLTALATILTSLMGAAAVLGALNTMLAAVGGRTREVGILVTLGYKRFPVFFSFLAEAAMIGVLGGTMGCLLVLPLNGVETSTTNWNTFTEAAFAFKVTAPLLGRALFVAVGLGLLGGTFPAWRASRLLPTEALRRL